MAITPGTFDVIFDAIKATLVTYNATQDAADQFKIYADYYRQFPTDAELANVFLYMGSIVPTERTTEGYTQQTVTYFIDMVIKAVSTSGGTVRADAAGGIRYRALVQQIIEALNQTNNFNFGEDIGTIGTKEFRIDSLPPDPQQGERVLVAGRLTLTLSMCYAPDELTGVDLEEIMITADKWSALIEP